MQHPWPWSEQQFPYRYDPFLWVCRYLYCFTVPDYSDVGSMKLTVFPGDLQGKTLTEVTCPYRPMSLSRADSMQSFFAS